MRNQGPGRGSCLWTQSKCRTFALGSLPSAQKPPAIITRQEFILNVWYGRQRWA